MVPLDCSGVYDLCTLTCLYTCPYIQTSCYCFFQWQEAWQRVSITHFLFSLLALLSTLIINHFVIHTFYTRRQKNAANAFGKKPGQGLVLCSDTYACRVFTVICMSTYVTSSHATRTRGMHTSVQPSCSWRPALICIFTSALYSVSHIS